MNGLISRARCLFLYATLAFAGVCFVTPSVHALSQDAQSTVSKAPAINQPSGEIPDWQARLELARLLSYVKRYDESLVEYGKVLAEQPALVEPKAEMARVLMWSGKTEEAKAILDAIAPDQLSGEDRLLQADLFAMRKEYGKAESLYRELLQASPDNQAIQLRLAEVLSWTKRYAESIKLYEKLVVASPNDVQLRRRYAQTLSWAGKTQDAIREFRRSLGQ
jgi:tetratricopeptide (TPR) repeat protein